MKPRAYVGNKGRTERGKKREKPKRKSNDSSSRGQKERTEFLDLSEAKSQKEIEVQYTSVLKW